MIDLQSEELLSLSDAAKRLPPHRRGRPVHPSCIFRWIFEGVRLPSRERVRLEAVRLGGRWLTSVEALQRFAERLTPRIDTEPGPTPRSPTQRRRASDQASKELDQIGI
jgi:hypothetical protein